MAASKMAKFRVKSAVKWEWMSLSQMLVWVSESEWIWEKITRCLNPRWQCLNPTWQNSRWLWPSSRVRMNEWSFFLWLNQMAQWCHPQEMNDWSFFCSKSKRQNSRWQVEWEWMSLRDWISFYVQNGWIKEGKFKSIIKLGKNEWVWVRLN